MGSWDVVIVGAGPVGLMLASELALHGVRPLVLERLTVDEQQAADAKMGNRSVTMPSVRAFDRRGMLPALKEMTSRGLNIMAAEQPAAGPKLAQHFAFLFPRAELLDFDDPEMTDDWPVMRGCFVQRADIRDMLSNRARELGADIRYGVEVTGFEVTGFEADPDGVTIHPNERIRASWLVGCDGARSVVRTHGGFDFPGVEPETQYRQAAVELVEPERLPIGWFTEPGVYGHVRLPNGAHMVFTAEVGVTDSVVTREEMQASLRRVTGIEVTISKIHLATKYTDVCRQSSNYRNGRVFIAGDAAHVHPPLGGQGMNLGIGDATNLGWKLAAAVHGFAPDDLLDTYTAERHPAGAWVQEWTMAQVAAFRPDPRSRALRKILREMFDTSDGSTYLVKKVSGLWQQQSAPDLTFADGSRLADHCHRGGGILFDFTGNHDEVDGYAGRVARVRVEHPGEALLVRPDGMIAWAPGDGGSLAAALRLWWGEPTNDL